MIAVLLAGLALAAPPAATEPTIAIVGGTVWTLKGPPIEGGTVLIRDGKIVAAGKSVEVPEGATRIDATGKVVTPGLVDASTTLGLTEISAIDTTIEYQLHASNPIHAAFRTVDGLNPASTLLPVTRMEGVTTAISRPHGGIVSGQSAWIALSGSSIEALVREAPVAMHAVFGEAALSSGGNTRGGVVRAFREALEDARLLRANRTANRQRRLRDLSASRLDLLALIPVLDRKIPLVIRAHKASDIQTALRVAREEKVRLVIDGGSEAWRVAPELAAAGVPVLVDPMTNLPGSFERLGARYDNAARLAEAGVTVALVTGDAHDVRKLRQAAGLAVANGMPREVALAAVTRVPLAIFGLDTRAGTLTPGKAADVVVWDGDPFELTTNPTHVFIRGVDIPLRSRQTELLDRYRTLPPSR